MKQLLTEELHSHLREIKEKLKSIKTVRELEPEITEVSFAYNWRIFKTSKGIFLVGTETKIFQAFFELKIAQQYMNKKMYGLTIHLDSTSMV